MSLKTFVAQVEGFIEKTIGGLSAFFKNYVQPAILFMEKVKAAVDSQTATDIASLLPGGSAELLVLRDAVGIALAEMLAILQVESEPTPEAMLQALVTFIKSQPSIIKSGLYESASAAIANQLSVQAGNVSLPAHQINPLVSVGYAEFKTTGTVTGETITSLH